MNHPFSIAAPRHVSAAKGLLRQTLFGAMALAWLAWSPATAVGQVRVGPRPVGEGGKAGVTPFANSQLVPSVGTLPRRLESPADLSDAGDTYLGSSGQEIRLLRATNEALLVVVPSESLPIAVAAAIARLPVRSLHPGEFTRLSDGCQTTVLRAKDRGRATDFQALRTVPGVQDVRPVLVDPETRKRMVPSGELIVRLRAGITIDGIRDWLREEGLELAETVGSARLRSYLLRVRDPSVDTLALARRLFVDPRFEWATPNFLRELDLDFTPDDPLFPRQFSLHNAGLEGNLVDADVDAVEAWDLSRGDEDIVIAIIDDGVDTTHPDLTIYLNPGESGGGRETNGVDDDGNGLIDDFRGWDFANIDNNPNPQADNGHGTACAGVAAARIHNGRLVSGVAGNCRVLPVKIFTDTGLAANDARIGSAISYAASMADVLSCSWGGGSPSAFIDSAIQDAVAHGRGGKGCSVFFANGNSASSWGTAAFAVGSDIGPGTYSFGFRYVKDITVSEGEDLVRVDNAVLVGPDGSTHLSSPLGTNGRQDFEGPFPPPGWSLSASTAAPWVITTTGAFSGTGGSRSARSGVIGNDQWTELRTPNLTLTGNETLVVKLDVSSETYFDGLVLMVYTAAGNQLGYYGLISGTQSVYAPISYPARHPDVLSVGASTDCDRRSDYSQYGPESDILAPSSGGWHGVTTLDPVGSVGYTSGDYLQSFGGTSAATPLAAGIGALLLSLKSDLTATEIRDILRRTADKVGPLTYPNGFNEEYGYGRINARRALEDLHLNVVSMAAVDLQLAEPSDAGAVTLARAGSTASPLAVHLLVSGTATGGSDYEAISSTVTIPVGSASVQVDIRPLDDDSAEGPETVILTIVSGSGYFIGTPESVTFTLLDNDEPRISIVAADNTASEPGVNSGRFTITRTGGTTAAMSVQLVLGGSAVNGSDFAPIGTTAMFAAGVSAIDVDVTATDDAFAEDSETLQVSLAPGLGYIVTELSSAEVAILDNDARVVGPPGVLRLDGIDDFATFAGSLWPQGPTLGSFTIELWARPAEDSASHFVAADDAYDFYYSPNGLGFVIYTEDSLRVLERSWPLPAPNQWNHMVITFDHTANQTGMFVNGVGQWGGLAPNSRFYTDPGQNFTLGARVLGRKSPPEGLFHGEIDELRISNVKRADPVASLLPTRFDADANTVALYHFDDPLWSTTFADSSGNGRTLTGVGGAHVEKIPGPEGPAPATVGHWRFDENAGATAGDSSGNGNEGALVNGPAWIAGGRLKGALDLDGVNDMLTIPNAPELELGKNNEDFTIALWVNLRQGANGNWRTVFHKGHGGSARTPSMWLHPDSNRLHYRVSTTDHPNRGGDSVGALGVGRWTHVAMLKAGSKLRLYLDGFLDSEVTLPTPVVHNSNDLYVGDDPFVAGSRISVDDLQIHRRALNDLELFDISRRVGHWQFTEGAGLNASDSSAYGNHAHLGVGTAAPAWIPNGSGSALSFDGVNDTVTVPPSTSLELGRDNADFTVAFWIYLEQGPTGAWRTIFHKGQAGSARTPSLWLYPDSNRLHYQVSTTGSTSAGGDSIATLKVNVWTHVAVVKTGSKLRLYLNGAADSQVTLSQPVTHNTFALNLGDDPWYAATKAKLDDVRIYDVALPQAILTFLNSISITQLDEPGGSTPVSPSSNPRNSDRSAILHKFAREPIGSLVTDGVAMEEDSLVIRWRAPMEAIELNWVLEESRDLVLWSPKDTTTPVPIGEDSEGVTLELRIPVEGPGPRFFRLKTSEQP